MDRVASPPGAGDALQAVPLGHRVRVAHRGRVVAESDGALRLDRSGQAPGLLLPRADLLGGALTEGDIGSLAVPGGTGPGDLVELDPGQVQIDVVDTMGSADPGDVTVKRFPTWGDLEDLLDILDVRPADPGRYTGGTRPDWRRPVVEGSQMLGQAVVAAGRSAPGRRVVSAHMVFMKVAGTDQPLDLAVETLSSGRTMSTLRVEVHQGGRCCASGTLLLDATAPDAIRHSVPPPGCAGPYESPPFDMGVTGRDLRMVDGAYDDDPHAPPGPPVIDSWVRFRPLPADPLLHAGLLAQYTGHMSIAAALRPHEGLSQRAAHRSLSTAVNAIAVSFHSEVRADRWMLYHHLSTFAGDGMTHSECRVHDIDGTMLASFSVDAMVRGMRAPAGHPEQTVL